MQRLALTLVSVLLAACSSGSSSTTGAGISTGGAIGSGSTAGPTGTAAGGATSGGSTGGRATTGGATTGASCGGTTCNDNEVCVDGACCYYLQACGNVCCPGNVANPASNVQFCANGACCPETQTCGLYGPDPFCCATTDTCNEGANFCCPSAQACGFLCCGPDEKCNLSADTTVTFCVRGSNGGGCTPTLSGAPSPVDTGVMCDGGGSVPTSGAEFPYLDSTDPTYEFQPCNSTAECGCAGAGKGLVCASDYNFATLSYPRLGFQGLCERLCTSNADCPRSDTVCLGGFCTLNLCGREIPFEGVSAGACDARGCRDGTCVPFPLESDAGSAFCVAAEGFVDGGCSTAGSITEPIPCDPGSACLAQGCQQLCNPQDADGGTGCPAGTGCFSIPGQPGDAGLEDVVGSCRECASPSGPCCLGGGSPRVFDTDCCGSTCDSASGECSPSP